MGVKQIIYSDITNADIGSDEEHARIVVTHPDLPQPVELDVTVAEAEKFQNTALRLVEIQVLAPNQPPRNVTLETRTLDKLFDGVDFDKVLEGARSVQAASAPRRASETAAAPRRRQAAIGGMPTAKGDKRDYASLEHCGELHKGRIAPEEARLVRENQERASQNRYAQTGKDINWDDPKEKQRYGL